MVFSEFKVFELFVFCMTGLFYQNIRSTKLHVCQYNTLHLYVHILVLHAQYIVVHWLFLGRDIHINVFLNSRFSFDLELKYSNTYA